MKPSERIKEISEKIKVDFPNALLGNGIDAIINYLDEEYERNKTPKQRQKEAERYWNS